MKKLELSKSNVDGKYILISTPNEIFFPIRRNFVFNSNILNTFYD